MTKENDNKTMTNEHNFKVGDKVRVKSTDIEDIIIDMCNDNVFLKDNGYWSTNVLELVESQDRRTAFLTRLQSLLKEHNATIQAYMSGVDTTGLCIYFADENVAEADYKQNDTICEITADNIMDFDKEKL